jgi:hypothetical protein
LSTAAGVQVGHADKAHCSGEVLGAVSRSTPFGDSAGEDATLILGELQRDLFVGATL